MKRQQHPIENLMALVLFAVFAVSVLGVLLLGADSYHRLTERDQKTYQRRTCSQYIATRVRQADRLDAIRISSFGEGDCLTFSEEVDGVRYLTRVYCWNGTLMELLTEETATLSPEYGEAIMEAQSLSAVLADGMLTVTVQTESGDSTLTLSLHSGEVSP